MKQLDRDVWVADAAQRFYGVEVGARMTVVRLADHSLFLHSPVSLTPRLRAAVEKVGVPRFAVAPNLLHHLYIGQWAAAYPDLKLFLGPGLNVKRPDLPCDAILDDEAPTEWNAEIEQTLIHGYPMLNEVVFCHAASRSLIVSDLVFNVREDSPSLTRVLCRMVGGYGHCGPSWLERIFVRNRAAARESIERILGWNFDRIILAHGHVLESGGRETLRRGYHWLLD